MNAPLGGQPEARGAWRAHPERSNYLALYVMRWIALHLGRRVARLLLWPIAIYFSLFNRKARLASRDYQRRTLGRPARWLDVVRHVHCFAATILDRIYLLNDRFDLFDITIDDASTLRERLRQGQGALLFGAHVGSFEAARALGRQRDGQRIVITMYEENARRIGSVLRAINAANAPDIIPLGRVDTMLRVRDALLDGAVVGLLADRDLGDEETRPVELLGGVAQLPLGPFRMAAMLRQTVIFVAGLYLGGNRYRVRLVQLADFAAIDNGARDAAIALAMQRYADELTHCCREAPLNWFNFFDYWQAGAARVSR